MDGFEKHTFKYLASSYAAICNFHSERNFSIIRPENKPISNKVLLLHEKSPDSSVYTFEIAFNEVLNEKKLSDKYLGLDEPLALSNQTEHLTLSIKSIVDLTVKINAPNILRGEITDLNSIKNINDEECYYRLLIPIQDSWETTLIQSASYTDKQVMYGSGLVCLNVCGHAINLFTHNNNDSRKEHLIIESSHKITQTVFERICESILKGLSVITGNWWGNQRFYLSSTDDSFRKIEGVYFKKASETIQTNHAIIDPSGFSHFMTAFYNQNNKIAENCFPAITLSMLSENILEYEELNRAILLVLEGNRSNSEILKSCSYLVAIETMAGLISKKNKAYFDAVQDSDVKSKLVNNLISCLQNFKNEIGAAQKQSLEDKIRNIASPSPLDKIIKSYSIYGIDLSKHKEWLRLIKSRNRFLHGKTPFEENEIRNKIGELQLNALRLNLLANILVLKFCGYTGHVKNLAGWTHFKVNQNAKKPLIEPIYYSI